MGDGPLYVVDDMLCNCIVYPYASTNRAGIITYIQKRPESMQLRVFPHFCSPTETRMQMTVVSAFLPVSNSS